jgi:S1-C subfamily serine protease
MKYIKMLLIMLFSTMAYATPEINTYTPDKPIENINADMPSIEKRVREAALKITAPFTGGHGSGSYIKYKDLHLVFTAQHVADGAVGMNYLTTYKQESHIATLIYSDPVNDIAVLYLRTKFRTVEPMKFNPLKSPANIGTGIIYSGYPSTHKLMSFTGRVAGYESGPGVGKEIILQTYGWFGCSGSMIYTLKGQQVGILYGVDIEYYPHTQVQENMIWVAPISDVNIDKAIKSFCGEYIGKPPKACK